VTAFAVPAEWKGFAGWTPSAADPFLGRGAALTENKGTLLDALGPQLFARAVSAVSAPGALV
jgi:hypothetical protein